MHLLAVSSQGELAVLVGAHYVWYRLFTGTLARMPLEGGAPREIQEGVRQADFSPDGSQLAIIREVGGKDRLEYPIGHVLREVSGYMSDLRFSPRGDRIAYFEHPRKWDDRGAVNVVDLAGNNTVVSDSYWSLRGLAWSPDGSEILFSASLSGRSYTVYGLTLDGKRRIAYQAPGGFTIQDVSQDGRWLATRLDYRYVWRWFTLPARPEVGRRLTTKIEIYHGSIHRMRERSLRMDRPFFSPRRRWELTTRCVCARPESLPALRAEVLREDLQLCGWARAGPPTFPPMASGRWR